MSGQARSHKIQYWAVGRDCCATQPSTFSCGDAELPAARAGLVVYNRTRVYDFLVPRDVDFYEEAARIKQRTEPSLE
jgi:hypothetical protein